MTDITAADLTPSTHPAAALLALIEPKLASRVAVDENAQSATLPSAITRKYLGHTYTQIFLPENKRSKKKAWYWAHGMLMDDEYLGKIAPENRWVCNDCRGFKSFGQRASDHIQRHLKVEHLKLPPQADNEEANSYEDTRLKPQQSLQQMLQHQPQVAQSRQLAQADKLALQKLKFTEALIAFIVVLNLSFSIVESPWFAAMLITISDLVGLKGFLITSHNTVASWVQENFLARRKKLKNLLASSKSRVHLSFDLWTSGNHKAFTAVVAHFCTPSNKIESILLGFRELFGPHSGENIAALVEGVVSDYNLESRLGCFILDNATNNDTCITALGKTYK
jgi:hypothetical protein